MAECTRSHATLLLLLRLRLRLLRSALISKEQVGESRTRTTRTTEGNILHEMPRYRGSNIPIGCQSWSGERPGVDWLDGGRLRGWRASLANSTDLLVLHTHIQVHPHMVWTHTSIPYLLDTHMRICTHIPTYPHTHTSCTSTPTSSKPLVCNSNSIHCLNQVLMF